MKSIATETIMKLFIMIAVILIASSFLLKAFNIDIFGFLKEKFGAPVPKSGKVLHVKIDPDQRSRDVEVWEFHLTDNKTHLSEEYGFGGYYFYIDDPLANEKCLLFTTDENSERDEGNIYYIDPSTTIQEGCTNIANCISGKSQKGCTRVMKIRGAPECRGNNCQKVNTNGDIIRSPIECANQTNYVYCGEHGGTDIDRSNYRPYCEGDNDDSNVIDQNFCEGVDCFWHSDCTDHPDRCNLLVSKKYKIKYGLICSDEKVWVPCTKEATDKNTIKSGKTCKWENEIGKWQ